MGRYKKGLKTKNKIVQASKSLFYFNSYRKTTVQGIADLADVNLGLISYYFKSKDNIAKSIFIGFLKEIEQEKLNGMVRINIIDSFQVVFIIIS